jgi:hypothetical protein
LCFGKTNLNHIKRTAVEAYIKEITKLCCQSGVIAELPAYWAPLALGLEQGLLH